MAARFDFVFFSLSLLQEKSKEGGFSSYPPPRKSQKKNPTSEEAGFRESQTGKEPQYVVVGGKHFPRFIKTTPQHIVHDP